MTTRDLNYERRHEHERDRGEPWQSHSPLRDQGSNYVANATWEDFDIKRPCLPGEHPEMPSRGCWQQRRSDAAAWWPQKDSNHDTRDTARLSHHHLPGKSSIRDFGRDQDQPKTRYYPSGPLSSYSGLYAWVSWIASVVLCSALLTTLLESDFMITFPFKGILKETTSLDRYQADYAQSAKADEFVADTSESEMRRPVRRRAACQSGGADIVDFNQPLRIGAVFIILVVSSLACAFPILAAKFPGVKMPAGFFFAVRHFGTGVLIATAFVHLLPTAFTLLGNPCLSEFWTDDYPAMPGAIALAGIFIVTIIEMLLHPARGTPVTETPQGAEPGQIAAKGPLRGRQASIGRSLSGIGGSGRDHRRDSDDKIEVAAGNDEPSITRRDVETGSQLDSTEVAVLTSEQKHKKDIMHCLLLEMGILFHSVFIGMALSLSIDGNEFVILLVAISFHQTFEGLALGARIAAIDWSQKSLQPIFMAIAYGCTTPIGQAIGLAARSAYSPDSEVGLILVGVMNAISAGLLVFASLVELLSEDLLTDESWRVLRGKRRVGAFLLVVAGAFGMSLVGAWA
ncbi:hypothetical protein AAE478_007888 [Parahypoxylon ruwenzoriense]